MLQNQKRHYLAQFYSANDNPGIRQRKANLVARAIYPKAGGVKSFASLQVRIVGLHENGATIQSSAIEFLPDHFYLCLGDGEIFFTCAKKNVMKAEMVVSFSKPEDTFFIEALSKINLPLATLKRMRDSVPPVIQARMVPRKA
ncbi:hypothetical protein [Neorhizobium alkalisoli]|jgi:hypothetical protein|uniref:PilZ domain-containing protein n=1 Tax=Neorhizobium alkalisoli TaxID=528178 RepID=A0A561QWV2_9HYPH|nr:hypothetical protein [Neorhizobium alkalisoli]TWF54828.1 hypothetical protein FHW37_103699 [Neorhizobium alkalisoli]